MRFLPKRNTYVPLSVPLRSKKWNRDVPIFWKGGGDEAVVADELRRLAFIHLAQRLEVGVAPTIPTLGDRRASGHSIIGLAVFDRSALRAEAIGRCWSQGRLLAWLADS
jgi:hypothetical protein